MDRGKLVQTIVRDYSNPFVGWSTEHHAHKFIVEDENGKEIEDIADIYHISSYEVLSSIRNRTGSEKSRIHWAESIELFAMEWPAYNLINSWISNSVTENIIITHVDEVHEDAVNKRLKSTGLKPKGKWEAGLFKDSFDGNVDQLTDDEYEMIFGESR